MSLYRSPLWGLFATQKGTLFNPLKCDLQVTISFYTNATKFYREETDYESFSARDLLQQGFEAFHGANPC